MRKRFVIGIQTTTAEQDKAFISFIESNGITWWHWIGGFWLLVDPQGAMTEMVLRDKLRETHPEARSLVICVPESTVGWAGFGPNTAEHDMSSWIRETWDK